MIGFTALNSWDMVVSEADLIVFKFGDAKLFDFNHKLPPKAPSASALALAFRRLNSQMRISKSLPELLNLHLIDFLENVFGYHPNYSAKQHLKISCSQLL